ncbi:Bifunctional purine biosynthetic protein ADE1 [Symbiodinium microadriaticum]|uniref:Bifunctional purine biosynthetic protein ADE1 n=1 Tax=Symbiodinium microadriaticum TaxID=2951 RepID=A0A1Q9CGX9_SYMMI|nr:Bifunctional purine biosynthetic protein ADE1 [Symbiodinium microadriaticum]
MLLRAAYPTKCFRAAAGGLPAPFECFHAAAPRTNWAACPHHLSASIAPTEFMNAGSRPAPTEFMNAAAGSRPAPTEFMNAAAGSRPAPAELMNAAAGSRPAPTEFMNAAAGSRPAPTEFMNAAAGSRPAPTEFMNAAAGSRPAPTEFMNAAAGSRPAPTEFMNAAAGSRPAPTEFMNAAAGSRPAPTEFMNAAAGSRPAPTEFMNAAAGSRPAPTEFMNAAAGSRPAPTEFMNAAAGSRPAPTEFMNAAAGSRPAPTEFMNAAAGSRPAPTEFMNAAAGSRPAPTEFMNAAAGSRPAPTEFMNAAAGSRPAPTELMNAAAGSRPAPTALMNAAAGSRNTVLSFIPNTSELAFLGLAKQAQDHLDREKAELVKAMGQNGSAVKIDEAKLHELLSAKVRTEKVVHKDAKIRTFIQEDSSREHLTMHAYDIHYGTVRRGQDAVVALDDSIVRGNTLKNAILRTLDKMGPTQIVVVPGVPAIQEHLSVLFSADPARSSCPQIRFPDVYGIAEGPGGSDFPRCSKDMAKLGDLAAFKAAAIGLLKERGKEHIVNEVYRLCRDELKAPLSSGTTVNHADASGPEKLEVQKIYESFTPEEISLRIAQDVTPDDCKAKVHILYQTVEDLHRALPHHSGDWYFTGDYPTPGGKALEFAVAPLPSGWREAARDQELAACQRCYGINSAGDLALSFLRARRPVLVLGQVSVVFVGPGNGGIGNSYGQAEPFDSSPMVNVDVAISADTPSNSREVLAQTGSGECQYDVGLVVVGPEQMLADGLADQLRADIPVFGGGKAAAQIEASKAFAKDFMKRHNIPTAEYQTFSAQNGGVEAALKYIDSVPFDVVVKSRAVEGKRRLKTSGPSLDPEPHSRGGGGVLEPPIPTPPFALNILDFLAFMLVKAGVHDDDDGGRDDDDDDANDDDDDGDKNDCACEYYFGVWSRCLEAKKFGDAGAEVVLEERMFGPECSILALCDGKRIAVLPPAQDHKRIFDGDRGPNTGGMGAFAPTPAMFSVKSPCKPFIGCLFAGLMITASGPKVIEFNCRFGDPEECQIKRRFLEILAGQDLYHVLNSCASGELVNPDTAIGVSEISGLERACIVPGVTIFHAGTKPAGDLQSSIWRFGSVKIRGRQTSMLHGHLDGRDAAEDLSVDNTSLRLAANGGRDWHVITVQMYLEKRVASVTKPTSCLTSGGRVLASKADVHVYGQAVTAVANGGIAEARERAYVAVRSIRFEKCHYRKDIGSSAIEIPRPRTRSGIGPRKKVAMWCENSAVRAISEALKLLDAGAEISSMASLHHHSEHKATYLEAGVDIEMDEAIRAGTRNLMTKTNRPGCELQESYKVAFFTWKMVREESISYDCLADPDHRALGYEAPEVATAMGQFRSIGTDLLALCANDIAARGVRRLGWRAEPLMFSSHHSCCQLDAQQALEVRQLSLEPGQLKSHEDGDHTGDDEDVNEGVAEGCREAVCAFTEAKTAEMPGVYSRRLRGFYYHWR